MTQVIGGEVVASMLASEGVDKAFGIVDGTYLGLLASFEKYGIELISPRHETTAAHMAGAYARATGKLGACIASNGPGVANILPGVAVENAEGNRVLLITSSRRQGLTYPDRGGTYQYFDQCDVIRPMSKWSSFAPSFERISEMMRKAFRIAWRGRPGVVHVDVPENVLNETYDIADDWLKPPSSYRRTDRIVPAPDQVARAVDLVRRAQRPMIHAGSGVIHAWAHAEVASLARRLRTPVTTSWGAQSLLRCEDRLSVPVSLQELCTEVRSSADLVLVIGSRLGETDWWGRGRRWGGPAKKVIQVDVDEDVIGLNKPVDLAVLGDAALFARALEAAFEGDPTDTERSALRSQWLEELEERKKELTEKRDMALVSDGASVHSAEVPQVARRVFGDDALMVIDGGNAAVWTTMFHSPSSANSVFSTFKFGMLGAGMGQALGVKAAHPERPVYCITGDGAMSMHLQEVETSVRQQLPVVFVVMCDGQWGMVKLTQQFGLAPIREVLGVAGEGTINADLGEVRFDEAARAMGAHGERVRTPTELEPALRRALESGRTAVVHVEVNPAQHLLPPGMLDFKEMHQEPEG